VLAKHSIQAAMKCAPTQLHHAFACITPCSMNLCLLGVLTNNATMICVYLQLCVTEKKPSDTIPEAQNFQILMSLVL